MVAKKPKDFEFVGLSSALANFGVLMDSDASKR
jgi:hypothetical protein